MRFELLGPVSVVAAGRRHSIPRAQTRGVLALLLLNGGHRLSREAVIEAIWGGAAPPTARAQIHNAVSDIRAHLARLDPDEIIVTEPFGYRADVDPDDVDVLVFERQAQLAGEASRAGDDDHAVKLLRRALDLWTGEPLQNIAGAFAEPTRARLVDARLTAIEDLADLELRHGRPEFVAAELAPLVHTYPMRERLRVRLMTALYRSGRQSDALRSARQYRALLAEREGLDPGPEIVEAEATIRRADVAGSGTTTATARPAATPGPAPVVPQRPAQLPAEPAGFAGRGAELATLDELCDGDGTSRIVALVGPGGAGKTALAVHWAYRRLAAFDGGQLYINLRGFGLDTEIGAFDALGQLLRGLGQPHDTLPADLDERAAQYRSLVAGRRMLIVLDNAAGSRHVRPLLPGVGPHVTLITSRRRLDSLAAGEGVRQIPLEPLSPPDAMSLLYRHVTVSHADDGVLADVARLCEGLPLALRIVAARLNATPADGAGGLVADLADERRRLTALSLPAEDTAVRSAFATSFQALSHQGRAMFRMMGLLPGPDTSIAACAATASLPVEEVSTLLEELRACHLVQRTPTGRYQTHDLIRLYARDLAERDEPAARRVEAERRLVEWYAIAADRADAVMRPHRGPFFRVTWESIAPPDVDTTADALAWFDTEADNLPRVVERAERVHPTACWQLAAAMSSWLDRHQRHTSWLEVATAGARAARAAGDRAGEALMRQAVAIVSCHLERFDEAAEAFTEVLAVRRELGQQRQIAITLMNLGNLYVDTDRDATAQLYFAEALAVIATVPDGVTLLPTIHINLGWAHRRAARYEQAVECYTRASTFARECADPHSIAYAETALAIVHGIRGRHEEAAAHWRIAVDEAGRAGAVRLEADALAGLGQVHLHLGDHDAARREVAGALAVYATIGETSTAEIAEMLSSITPA